MESHILLLFSQFWQIGQDYNIKICQQSCCLVCFLAKNKHVARSAFSVVVKSSSPAMQRERVEDLVNTLVDCSRVLLFYREEPEISMGQGQTTKTTADDLTEVDAYCT